MIPDGLGGTRWGNLGWGVGTGRGGQSREWPALAKG